MKLELKRITPKEREWDTLGLLYINDVFSAVTLEDRFREDKIPKTTRIPSGTYPLTLRTVGTHHGEYLLRYGGTFHKGMIQLSNVHNFSDILIHIGNYAKDTDGCILVGTGFDFNDCAASSLIKSTVAYVRIYPAIRDAILKEPTYIIVGDQ